jgi:small subunit ribosomal protein S9
MTDTQPQAQQFLGTGRRKTSVAQVRLLPGAGKITINGRPFEGYFLLETLRMVAMAPLVKTESAAKFDVVVTVRGGGPTGQAGAVRMGIARALLSSDANLRPVLKADGFLTRDARMKERKKYGQPGARKRFQFSKR